MTAHPKVNNKKLEIGSLVYRICLNAKNGEKILIVTDAEKMPVASIFVQAAKTFSKNVQTLILEGMTENGQEPSEEIREALYSTDIAILVTSYSLSHTKTRLEASARGARIISMPGITNEIMNRSIDVDYADQTKRTDALQEYLTKGNSVTIRSPGGTDVTFSIKNRVGFGDTGLCTNPGDFINLPAGEAFIAPVEDSARGMIVFDGAIASIPLDKPITLTLKNGTIESLAGGTAAHIFGERLDSVGPKARIICEFGIGTNEKAIVSPEILEAEKVSGTCHIAFGRNITFGGTNDVSFHTDGLILKPTIIIDNLIIMSSGKLLG
ncbi:MAG TPA: aminopeptidase [Patescibacteria group bacterium]|nr:aminopeptidase [Patescibacteria group bacterium]